MKRLRRILFATDFAPASHRAFAAALTLAKPVHAALTILYVMPPAMPTVPEQYLDGVTIDRLTTQARRWSEGQLTRLAGVANRAGVAAKPLFRDGDAAGEIVRAARRERTDLIVVGTHGRHGLPKLLLGSVAERVVRLAPCPVLTARGK
ncbi:MAG TPA: universal stress protein [Vicinamibacterales bacterium]|nr:universal stress protein [Vicinamibacterales bacterium]